MKCLRCKRKETKQKKNNCGKEKGHKRVYTICSVRIQTRKKTHTAQHNNKRRQAPAPAPVPAQATTNSAICTAKEKKGLHKNGTTESRL